MPAIVVTQATGADAEASSAAQRKMFIATEDRSLWLIVPYAPSEISYDNRARTTATIDRPGRTPILSVLGMPLATQSFDLFFGDPDPDVSVQGQIQRLEQIAGSGARVVVNFGPGETGLWRITSFSYQSVQRHQVDQSIIRATASIEFTRASDYVARVGPLSGGASSGVAGGGGGTTYTVKAGDTLGKIANHFYGDPRRWRLIATANKIRNPKRTRKLKPGRTLTIPRLTRKRK